MAFLPLLYSRDTTYWGWGSGSTGNARWAFFAIFIVIIIVIAIATVRANKKRSRHGVAPIYGTRWMTPPSYRQSQTQSGENTQRGPDIPSSYVPAYSAEATNLDMGHYDNLGKFHANPRVNDPNTPIPEQAHHHANSIGTSPAPATNLSHVVSDEDDPTRREHHSIFFNRPRGPPPPSSDSNTTFAPPPGPPPPSDSNTTFAPPPGPPPSHSRGVDSIAELLRSESTNSESAPTFLGEKSALKVTEKAA